MTIRATGTFEVTSEDEPYAQTEGVHLLRSQVSKTFRGDLEAESTAELIKAVAAEAGSAGYVGIERVTGSLQGRPGSFVLQHSGTMNRGEAELVVRVVPDSATGELRGLRGQMEIDVVEGQHTFTFDYTLD